MVKIDLAAHVDGFVSTFAHTVVATDKPAEAITGKKADVICAAYFAGEAAVRLIRSGHKNSEVTDVFAKVAKDFGVNVVEAVLSHKLRRFTLDDEAVIISKETSDNHVDTVDFEEPQCWSIDVIMTTGEGKPKLGEAKTTVFKRVPDEKYSLKQASSREMLNHVAKVYDNLAFSQRSVREVVGSKALLAFKEMGEHGMLNEYPVLYEKKGDFVAQFKFTVLATPKQIEKLNSAPLPYVSSSLKVEDASVNQIMQLPLVKPKAAPAAAATAPAASEGKK
jgi:curved DNA binding protein